MNIVLANTAPTKYLSKELKKYYQDDLANNLQYLDSNVKEYIQAINENPKIQTIFSHRSELIVHKGDERSYLSVAFFKEIEDKLSHQLDLFVSELPKAEFLIHFGFIDDQVNLQSSLGYENNSDYFDIVYFNIRLESNEQHEHETFWQLLSEGLTGPTLSVKC